MNGVRARGCTGSRYVRVRSFIYPDTWVYGVAYVRILEYTEFGYVSVRTSDTWVYGLVYVGERGPGTWVYGVAYVRILECTEFGYVGVRSSDTWVYGL